MAGGFSIVGLVLWLVYRYEKQRTEDLAMVADNLGLQFSRNRDEMLLQNLQAFSLFNRGHSRRMKNVMTAETELAKLTVFDYQFTTGAGKTARTNSHTLIAMESDSLQIPQFSIQPEGFFEKIGAKLGMQDINFDEHPEFSEMFVVQSNEEAAIRRFLDAEIIEMLQERKEIAINAVPGLFTYRGVVRKKGKR